MIPVLPPHQAMKTVPAEVEIYQYDASPVAGRQPVLVVHGLLDEHAPSFHMQNICRYLSQNQNFQKHYKIYLARYNTSAPEKNSEAAFKSALCRLSAEENSPLEIVAVSLSGSTIRNAMADPAVDKAVSRMITLGTPFHGSPLFSRDWILYSTLTYHKWPVRLLKYIAYKLYFHLHPNLLADYYWDNYDRQMPSIGTYRFKLPFLVSGELLPASKAPDGSSYTKNGEKIIAYAGYMQNFLTRQSPKGRISITRGIASFCNTSIPAYFGEQHAMLRLLNCEIALVVGKDKQRQTNYAFNDGISPIISAVSSSSSEEYNLNDEKEALAMEANIGVKKARLFANIDHVTFLDGRVAPGCKTDLVDKFAPEEKARPIFAWLLGDLSQ